MYMDAYIALFTLALNWKLSKFSSIREWINEMWYIHALEYYTVLGKNKPKLCATTWMNLTNYKVERKKPDTKQYMV